jgi:hypothetical protein
MARLLLEAVHSPDRPPRKVLLTTQLEVRFSSAPVAWKPTGEAG